MGNPLIMSPAIGDAAILTDPNAQPTNPGKLQTMQPGDAWGYGTTPAVVADLGAAYAINTILGIQHNGSSIATWRIRAADTQAHLTDGNAVYDITTSLFAATGKPAEPWDRLNAIRHDPAGLFTARWVRMDIADANAPNGEFLMGRLFIAAARILTRAQDFGWSLLPLDPGEAVQSVGGQLWPPPETGRPRIIDMTLPYQSEADAKRQGFELMRLRGASGDVAIVRDADATDFLHVDFVHGLMTQRYAVLHVGPGRWQNRYTIKEMLP